MPRLAWRWLGCFLVLVAAAPVTIDPPYRNGPPIRADGVGYHAWTRALLERDLDFCYLSTDYAGAISNRGGPRGVCQDKYPPGVALVRLPVMAFLVDTSPGAPLITDAEHRASLYFSAFTLLLICVVATATCRLLRLSAGCTSLAVLAFVFGAGLFHHGTYDGSSSHIYSALGVAVLIWLGVRAQVGGAGWPARLASAVTAFLLVATRNTNIFAIVILLLGYLAWTRAGRNVRWAHAVPVLAGVAGAVALQIAYNLYATGHLAISSYGAEGFRFDNPGQTRVLLSYEQGLFTWYPVVAVVLAAALFVRATRIAAIWFSALIGAFALLYGFWTGLGGFGNRGFVELMPAGIVLFAFALTKLRPGARSAIGLAALVASFMTVELMGGYWRNTVPFSGSTADIYWSHVVGKESWLP